MNILHVTQPTSAGVARHVLDLVESQARAGERVTVTSPVNDAFESLVAARGADWIQWDATRTPDRALRTEMQRLSQVVAAVTPDIVHLHSSKAGLAGRLLHIDAPRIFTPNGWSMHAASGVARAGTTVWERFAARRAARIVCVSRSEMEFARQHRIQGRFEVIANAVDTARLAPLTPEHAADLAAQLVQVRSGRRVVCVGRLTRAKGQSLLLAAWPAVRAVCTDAILYLVGDGEDEEELRAHPAVDESVVFAGHSDDPQNWLAVGDVVVVPSRWDGLSYVLLEAMAMGASIVATTAVGAVDALGRGYAGLTTAMPDDLAQAIVERLIDPELRRREGAELRSRAVREFDLAAWAGAHARLYRSVLGE